jgi:hypothetical protein
MTKDQVESGFNKFGAMINWDELNELIGLLLTYVDATYQDKEQREAHKSLVRNTVRDWYNRCEDHLPVKMRWEADGISTISKPFFSYWSDQKEHLSGER